MADIIRASINEKGNIIKEELKEGEISGVIETTSNLYVVRIDADTDEAATETNRQNIIANREAALYEEVVTGQAEVRSLFKLSKVGTIAGCYVTNGSIKRDCGVRLLRNSVVIYEGKLASLKRFQNDAKEVTTGYECGITIENFNDIKEGDTIEGFVMEEVKR